MAKARSRNGKPVTIQKAARSEGPVEAKLSLETATPPEPPRQGVAPSAPLPAGAANGMFVVDISEDLEITGKFLCKVPMANDVLYCSCGGVMSQRFNESLFCRTCGREGTH